MNIPIQFAFEYEVIKVHPDTKEETIQSVWTTIRNKEALKGPDVKEVRLKQNNDTRN